jgi:hypothetical protein
MLSALKPRYAGKLRTLPQGLKQVYQLLRQVLYKPAD